MAARFVREFGAAVRRARRCASASSAPRSDKVTGRVISTGAHVRGGPRDRHRLWRGEQTRVGFWLATVPRLSVRTRVLHVGTSWL
jgi:hypothetical protein